MAHRPVFTANHLSEYRGNFNPFVYKKINHENSIRLSNFDLLRDKHEEFATRLYTLYKEDPFLYIRALTKVTW
ncbi:hypothetical protein BAT02nite_33450 [Bacillus atrophaeus]|nr:hypothetical protein BAT02nite_33450 [Bacillus atrophaeus]